MNPITHCLKLKVRNMPEQFEDVILKFNLIRNIDRWRNRCHMLIILVYVAPYLIFYLEQGRHKRPLTNMDKAQRQHYGKCHHQS